MDVSPEVSSRENIEEGEEEIFEDSDSENDH